MIFLIEIMLILFVIGVIVAISRPRPAKEIHVPGDSMETEALRQRVEALERIVLDPDRRLRRDFDGL